ncbi:MAG: tetratricopeptide repeat protein, partial [Cytophagales bacterium]|nr:tetratricopeptide repeat protein [Cytophagales bacterium]
IEQYKSEPEAEEAREIVSKAFLQTSNYDLAINYIEGLSAKNTSIRETYQRVTFLKGSQLFNQSRFSDAITYFNKSIQYPINRELEDAAYYWKGEAYAIARKYDQAIDAFNMVLKAGARSGFDYKVQYSLGYAYYNQKAYDKAIPYFTRYLQKNDQVAVNSASITDARLRLADCYYTQKKFDTALTYYQQVANSDFALRDYALYQAGMSAFLKPDYELAERSFSSLISRFSGSTYVDDALFQRAQIAFENGVYREAIDGFTQLIEQYGTSNLLPFAHVRRAVSNFNLKSYGPAKEDYIKVITDYPSHSMANSAILGLQEVMTLEGSTEDFDQYLSMYRQANPESTNLESVDFESARSTYFNQR